MGLMQELSATFPWMAQLGLSPGWFQNLAATAASSGEIVAKIRETPQYKGRFPGMTRADGTVRMNEQQYMAQEASYRNLLTQYGFDVAKDYAKPASLIGWFEGDVAPDELRDRLNVYKSVSEGGQNIRDAFYVYAGMDISVDQLYDATVDPAAGQRLSDEYNQKIAASKFDYTTYITRATEVANSRVATALKDMQSRGAVTGQVVQRILATDPSFARQIMDQLYHGGDPNAQTGTLGLQDLLSAYEYAAIGAAAENAGLGLPTKERLAEIRAAGVDRAKAINAYSEYGKNSEAYRSAVERARGTTFSTKDFESATFLGDAAKSRDLTSGLGYMESAGRSQGSFRFREDAGRITQSGFTTSG